MAEISPLQIIAEASWGNNTAVAVSNDLTVAIDQYTGTALLAPLANAVANAASAMVGTANLILIASNTCPALGNSPPDALIGTLGNIISQYGNIIPPDTDLGIDNFTNIVLTIGDAYLSGNTFNPTNTSVFSQLFQASQSFAQQTNQYVNAVNEINDNIAPSFTNYNNYVTGGLTAVTLATVEFGQDLEALGVSIDLSNLDNLGSPAALLAQIVRFGGLNDVLFQLLTVLQVPSDLVTELADPDYEVSDEVNQRIYVAFNAINTTATAQALSEILSVLSVTTANITSLADLLNPVKMFPRSYQTLSVPTSRGSTAIYVNASGAINSNLLTLLPDYVITTESA